MLRGRSIRLLRDVGLMLLLASPVAALAADEEAKAKFEAAETAFDLGDFDKARRLYSEAYELKPLPGFLFNIGQCHKKLGEWNRAAFYYRRYLARMPEGADTSKVEGLIAEMDAKAALPAPSVRDVEPPQKPHAAVAKLTPAVAVTPPSAAAATSAPPIVIREAPESPYKQWWFWAGAGVATAATVVAVVAVGIAASNDGDGRGGPPRYGKLDAR